FSLMSVAGARAAAALGIPLAVEVNAPLREEARRFRKAPDDGAARAAEEETFMAAGRIFAVSPALARWLSRPDRVEVMPNAPPVRQFAAKAPVNGAQRELVVG